MTTADLHEIGTIITALAAVIAAVSSLRNGQTLNGKHQEVVDALSALRKRRKKKTQSDESKEWFKAPDVH